MNPNETDARIKARIWQAIAQSEINTGDMTQDDMNALVDLATSAALLEMDAAIDREPFEQEMRFETAVSDADILDDDKEDVLWEGRPFLSLNTHYLITDERIRITYGMFGKNRENIELVRVQDLDYQQTFSERLLKLGDITIHSHDQNKPLVHLRNVKDPDEVYEILRRAVLSARKKHNFTYREEM